MRLASSSTVGIVAPSFFIEREVQAADGIRLLQHLGYKLKYSESVFRRYQNTTAPIETRVKELHTMFEDPEVNAIVCTDGGLPFHGVGATSEL